MIGIYHSRDLDGWVSGALIKEKYPDAKMIGYDYGEEFPWHLIDDFDERIIMADVSLPIDDMIKLSELVNGQMTWIDHHKTAIAEMEDVLEVFYQVVDSKYAACELVWAYFNVGKPVPRAIELLGMYDSFRHKGTVDEDNVMHFQYFARSVASNINDANQFLREDYDIERGIGLGRIIFGYLCSDARYKYEKMKYSVGFNYDGRIYTFAMINGERFNPANFGIDYHNDGYAGAGCFWYVRDKGWVFSLYSDKVDCSAICKSLGGGGHVGAAGFITQDIGPYL